MYFKNHIFKNVICSKTALVKPKQRRQIKIIFNFPSSSKLTMIQYSHLQRLQNPRGSPRNIRKPMISSMPQRASSSNLTIPTKSSPLTHRKGTNHKENGGGSTQNR